MHASRSQSRSCISLFLFFHFLVFFFLWYCTGCLDVLLLLAVMLDIFLALLALLTWFLSAVMILPGLLYIYYLYILFLFLFLCHVHVYENVEEFTIQSASCFFLASRTYVARFSYRRRMSRRTRVPFITWSLRQSWWEITAGWITVERWVELLDASRDSQSPREKTVILSDNRILDREKRHGPSESGSIPLRRLGHTSDFLIDRVILKWRILD